MNRRGFIKNSAFCALMGSAALKLFAEGKKNAYKLGVCDWSFGYAGDVKGLAAAKAIGLDGLQISAKDPDIKSGVFMTPPQIEAYKAESALTGIAIASVATTGISKAPFAYTDEAEAYLKSAIDAAAALNCGNILMPFFGPSNMLQKDSVKMDEKHFAPLVEKLKRIAPYAAQKKVEVCLEDSISAADNRRVIEAVQSPFIKVYFDIFNNEFYGHPSSAETIRELKGLIGQVHIKVKTHKLLKEGVETPKDLSGCIDALLETGYKGWLVMETHGYNAKKMGPADALFKANAEFLRESKFFM